MATGEPLHLALSLRKQSWAIPLPHLNNSLLSITLSRQLRKGPDCLPTFKHLSLHRVSPKRLRNQRPRAEVLS